MESPSLETNLSSTSSHFIKTICLRDWWLIKSEKEVEGKTLAIAGLTSTGQEAVRVFSSSPIIKRYDVFTLETADKICVVIKGLINKLRTCENGFSSEVFDHFLFGFPFNWEECALRCLERESTNGVDLEGNCSFNKLNMNAEGMKLNKIINKPFITYQKKKEIIDNPLKGSYIDNNNYIDSKVSISQNKCHLNAMQSLVNINVDDDTGHVTPSNKGSRPITSKLKNQKGNQQDTSASRSDAKDNEHSSAADVFKYPDEEKSQMMSSTQNRKRKSYAKGAGTDGTKKKLKFDNVSPLNQGEKKTPVLSPELMSLKRSRSEKKTPAPSPELTYLKRSRSGRLLVPTLDFWRNQAAVYDADRQITGIREGVNVGELSRGSKSKTRGRR